MPQKGKAASTRSDFMQGLRGWFGHNSMKGKSADKIYAKVKDLGKNLEDSGMKHSFTVKDKKGKEHVIDFLNPESYNTGWATEKEYLDILSTLFFKQQTAIGKDMMKWAMSEEWTSISENWGKLVGGTLIMNLRTMMAIAQGNDVPMDDIMVNVLMGAALNRKGMPRTYDMNVKKMNDLRRNLDFFGYSGKNYFMDNSTFSKGKYEYINGLNHPIFNDVNKLTDDLKIKTRVYEETEIKPKGVTADLSQKDLDLF